MRDEKLAHLHFNAVRDTGEFFNTSAESVRHYFETTVKPLYLYECGYDDPNVMQWVAPRRAAAVVVNEATDDEAEAAAACCGAAMAIDDATPVDETAVEAMDEATVTEKHRRKMVSYSYPKAAPFVMPKRLAP